MLRIGWLRPLLRLGLRNLALRRLRLGRLRLRGLALGRLDVRRLRGLLCPRLRPLLRGALHRTLLHRTLLHWTLLRRVGRLLRGLLRGGLGETRLLSLLVRSRLLWVLRLGRGR